jgi:uncharacterized protein (TIGR03663 family)
MESGGYWYRPIVHGPFLTIVDSYVFSLLGASDFTMRLIVALIGGLLPLSALLVQHRLRASETLTLALLLAANPVLLYYSRFFRNDVLLAGFMFAAFGCFLRAYDSRRSSYLYAGTFLFALAFTTKENALVYPVSWVGATLLIWDRRLLVDRVNGGDLRGQIIDRGKGFLLGAWNWTPHLVLAVIEFFMIFVFFYAPRGQGAGPSPTLGATIGDPTLLPALIGEATLGSWEAFVEQWGSGNEASYLSAAEELWTILLEGALVVLVFAFLGFLVDRYTGEHPRSVVVFTFFWGLSSVLGYPIIVDNPFPWEVVHMVVPLTVPAAVGLVLIGRFAINRFERSDIQSATIMILILLVAVGQIGATAYNTSFVAPQSQDNELVQYAQPSSEMKPLLSELRQTVQLNDGIDVLFYGDDPSFNGDELYAPNRSSHATPRAGQGWFERLPFAWYLEVYGATTNSTDQAAVVGRIISRDDWPPVLITLGSSATCSEDYDNATDIDQYVINYERHKINRFLYDSGCIVSSMVVYIDPELAANQTNVREQSF